MIKNYFKIAFRNLIRHKGFSLINITGLAIGMAAFMLIFMYVRFELSYDNFHEKGDAGVAATESNVRSGYVHSRLRA